MKAFKFGLGSILFITLAALNGVAQEFTFTTTASNTMSSKATLDIPGLANNSLAIIVATPLDDTEKSNPHPIGAWYYNGKWNIFNSDHAALVPGLRFKVRYFLKSGPNQFLHVVTKENLGAEGSYIDSPVLNNNPKAQVTIFQNHAPDYRAFNLNASDAKAGYDAAAGKWYVVNINGKRMYPNTAYNIVVILGVPDDSARPASPERLMTQQVPASLITQSTPPATGTPCTNESAYQTPGSWGKQKKDDTAMADNTFPKTQYKAVLAKAQKVVPLLMHANPEFKGLQAYAKRGIRGDSYSPGGALPFRIDAAYDAYICLGSDTGIVEARGKVILSDSSHPVSVHFNSLGYLLESVIDGEGFRTADGDVVYAAPKQIGEFKGFALFRPASDRRSSNAEAVVIAPAGRTPIKPVTREQFLRTRLKSYQDKTASSANEIAYLEASLKNMTPAELQSQAIVSNVFAVPGKEKIFTTEATGGKPIAIVDKSFFDPNLARDTIQLITVAWAWDDKHPSRVEMMRQFKQNFDFEALRQMLGT